MADSKKGKCQRIHKRFIPKEWVSALCQTPFAGIGMLVDISMGGAAFQYVERPSMSLALLKSPLTLDLFETVTSHSVKEMKCNIVYDAEVPDHNNSTDGYRLRRCAVAFGQHSWQQLRQLNMFIKDFTIQGY